MRRLLLLILCTLGLVFTVAIREAGAVVSTPSSDTWTCVGGETDFTPSFAFVTYQHVTDKIDSVVQVLGTDYTWFDADTFRLNSGCSAGEVILAVRDSDPSNPVVTFTSGSRLTADSLNDALLQNIYAMEELEENTTVQGMNKSGGHWDAASLRIQNCSDALGDTEVACYGQLTIANADLYPSATTDNKILKGNGSAYVEAESIPDAVIGDATKLTKVNAAGNGLEYAEKVPNAVIGDAEKLVTVNAAGDGFDYDTFANYMAAWAPEWATDTDTAATGTGVISGFSAAVTVPATGTWNIEVYVQLQALAGTGGNKTVQYDLKEGAGVVASFGYEDDAAAPTSAVLVTLPLAYFKAAAGAGTYTYTVDVTALTNMALNGTSTHPQLIRAVAVRTD